MAGGNEIDNSQPKGDAPQGPDFSDYIGGKPIVLAQADTLEGDLQARRDIERMITGLTDSLKGTNDLATARNLAERALGPGLDSNQFNNHLQKADEGWPNEGGYRMMQRLMSQALRGSGYSAQFVGPGMEQPLVIKKGTDIVWPRPPASLTS